ncbi:hypothetical protein ACFYMB_18290 [Micromonospora haikouensis]|uniref:hypothetical protein n=1 Tax=Micromonospora haikouensis TaxID=686309 RepID=UPI00367D5782
MPGRPAVDLAHQPQPRRRWARSSGVQRGPHAGAAAGCADIIAWHHSVEKIRRS